MLYTEQNLTEDQKAQARVNIDVISNEEEIGQKTSEGANDGNTSEEWLNLIATKPNWTITLK